MVPLLVFIHRSNSWYLYYTIRQARIYHPNCRIVLLTDFYDPILASYVEIYDLSKYQQKSEEFKSVYRHLSTNPYEFEIFCFQRWMILLEFLKKECPEGQTVIYLDSDVLTLANLLTDLPRTAEADVAIVGHQGPYTMFVKDISFLEGYVDTILELFAREVDDLESQYMTWRKSTNHTAVSDMHALHTFISRSGLKAIDLSIPYDGRVYDTVIDEPNGFIMENGIKKLIHQGDIKLVQLESGEQVQLMTAHCAINSKRWILKLNRVRDWRYFRDKLRRKLSA